MFFCGNLTMVCGLKILYFLQYVQSHICEISTIFRALCIAFMTFYIYISLLLLQFVVPEENCSFVFHQWICIFGCFKFIKIYDQFFVGLNLADPHSTLDCINTLTY